MPSPFPHRYDVQLVAKDGRSVLSGGGRRPEIVGGAPPEFDGSDEWWSPEHLLLASASLCLTTTFEAFARRARLAVDGFECRAHGVLEKTAGGLAFTSIRLAVDLRVAEADRARAEQLLESAKKHCIVANALKPAVELEILVAAAAG
ncbi:MAG TPA: OsmC family protein [Vicinamibacteria bacterium]|nr:OsmC family protein [Vicinamibacteria bacterium]